MPRPTVAADALPAWWPPAFERLRADLQLETEFPPEVTAVEPVEADLGERFDARDLELVTLDPPDSMDLDQAFAIERSDTGYRVHYAIADVAAFVVPGGPIDVESQRRVETLYAPDRRIPLHPPALSEGAASLLPDQDRPAVLWTIDLDEAGEQAAVEVRRARVRSRAKLNYADLQKRFDDGTEDPLSAPLRDVGELRLAAERRRGGVSLPLPEQVVSVGPDGWLLEQRTQLPVETWNAQLSLLTGMAAAGIMLAGGIGLLRTVPAPSPEAVAELRGRAVALGFDWPADLPYPEFVRSIDPATPRGAALLRACTRLLRGAGYVALDGPPADPATTIHSAIAAPYAHVTAPLRRLADRYAIEACLALHAGIDVPDWARTALPGLPALMTAGDRRANKFTAEILNIVEAGLLAPSLGKAFDAVVVTTHTDATKGTLLIEHPAAEAPATSAKPLVLGERVSATLTTADPMTRQVAFTV